MTIKNIFLKIYEFFTTRDCPKCTSVITKENSVLIGGSPSAISEWTCPNCGDKFIENDNPGHM